MNEAALNLARQVSIPDYLVALYAVEPNRLGTQTLARKVIEQTSLSLAFGSKHALDLVFYSDRATLDLDAKQEAEAAHLAVVTDTDLVEVGWLPHQEKARFVKDNLDLVKVNNAKLRGVAATQVMETMAKAAAAGLNVAAIRAANGLVGDKFDNLVTSKRIDTEIAIYRLHRKHPHLFSAPPYFRDRAGGAKRLKRKMSP
jgi:hypothetical protein